MLIWNDTCLPNELEVTTNVQCQDMLKNDAGDLAHIVEGFVVSLRSRWDHPTELLTRISQLHLQMTCTCRSMFTTAVSKPSHFLQLFLSRWKNSVRTANSCVPSMYRKASQTFSRDTNSSLWTLVTAGNKKSHGSPFKRKCLLGKNLREFSGR